MHGFFLAILFIFSGDSAIAEGDPNYVNLTDPGASMSHVAVRDQDPFADCYAAVAVQLLDAYRFSHGDNNMQFQGSALVLAAAMKRSQGMHSIGGGKPCAAVAQAVRGGVCNDNALQLHTGTRIERYTWNYTYWQQLNSRFNTFQKELDAMKTAYINYAGIQRSAKQSDECAPAPQYSGGDAANDPSVLNQFCSSLPVDLGILIGLQGVSQQLQALQILKANVTAATTKYYSELATVAQEHINIPDNLNRQAAQITSELASGGYDAASIPSLDTLRTELADFRSVDLIQSITEKTCTGPNHLPSPVPGDACKSYYLRPLLGKCAPLPADADKEEEARANQLLNQINTLLQRPNAQPVSIKICDGFISQGVNYNSHVLLYGDGTRACSTHVMLIIGRRINPNSKRMEYLARSSWGSSCYVGNYSKDYECVSGTGDHWIDAKTIGRNTYGLDWIQ